jgi:hypothetical protein
MMIGKATTDPVAACVAAGWFVAGRWPRPPSASRARPVTAPPGEAAESRPRGRGTSSAPAGQSAQLETDLDGGGALDASGRDATTDEGHVDADTRIDPECPCVSRRPSTRWPPIERSSRSMPTPKDGRLD